MSWIKAIWGGVRKYTKAHKFISTIIAIVVLVGAYYVYSGITAPSSAPKYVLAAVQQGTFVSSVTGTGQVSASTELNVQPQTSGAIVSIPVTEGQSVSAGDVLARLDSTSAENAVRNAQLSLDSANLSLQQLEQPPTQLQLTQDQNAVSQAEASQQTDTSNLTNDYQNSFNSIVNSFVNLPGVMSGLETILNGPANFSSSQDQSNANAYYNLISTYTPNAQQFETNAINSYNAALTAYNQNLQDYSDVSRYSSTSTISSLLNETYNTTDAIAEAVKNAKDFLDLVNTTLSNTNLHITPPAVLATHESEAQSYTSTVNSDLNSLLTEQNALQSDAAALNTSSLNLIQANEALQELQAGPTALQIQAQKLSIQSAQNSLDDAEQTLSYCIVRAPFSGIVAALPLIVGDQASTGSTIATLITKQGIAGIQLNEVDAAKIKLNDQATLTFPALPNVTIAGNVSEIDTIGTVSQGVVTFNVQITFDSQNTSVKPGMSVSAAIVTDVEPNVLLVPNSAVQTQSTGSYVQVLDVPGGASSANTSSQGVASATPPTFTPVQVGASNNTQTVITSGLTAGQLVVTRTVAAGTAATQTTSAASTRGVTGGGFGGGAVFRAGGL